MRKLFVQEIEKNLTLTGESHRHVALVLRAKVGEQLTICNGDGYDYFFNITAISKQDTKLALKDKQVNITEPTLELTLFSAVLKGDKNDTVVRTATELGVYTIAPIITEFIATKPDSYKLERLQKIALEAAKQSDRGRVPSVNKPIDFHSMCGILSTFDLAVFPYEGECAVDINTFLRNKFNECFNDGPIATPIKKVAVIVGGEGGFSKSEVLSLSSMGTTPVTLGGRILRADTAVATVCAIIMYEAGQMR